MTTSSNATDGDFDVVRAANRRIPSDAKDNGDMNVLDYRALVLFLMLGSAAQARQVAPFRSAAHPFNDPRELNRQSNVKLAFQPDVIGGPALAAANNQVGWYSSEVNAVQCSLLLPDETWLGTGFGIKRLDRRTRTVRHYTILNGLPYSRDRYQLRAFLSAGQPAVGSIAKKFILSLTRGC